MTPERHAVKPSLEFEFILWKNGLTRIAGIDEAGRGAMAGPVCAAAVILPPDPELIRHLDGVRDSKLMTANAREKLAPRICSLAAAWGTGTASAAEIDSLGILHATKLAATRAMEGLHPDFLITDFLIFPETDFPQVGLVKGDQLALSVAAASILAKTTRDQMMRTLDRKYPSYGFAQHKGYGTRLHREAMEKVGMCPEHRKTFSFH